MGKRVAKRASADECTIALTSVTWCASRTNIISSHDFGSTALQADQDGVAVAGLAWGREWAELRASTCPHGGHYPHRRTIGRITTSARERSNHLAAAGEKQVSVPGGLDQASRPGRNSGGH